MLLSRKHNTILKMRLFFTCFIALFVLAGCDKNNDDNQRNPFLIDLNFNTQLSAIQAIDLEIPGNAIYVPNGGIRGFFVINTGSGLRAWEASDPNHSPNECSQMILTNDINVTCQCDDAHSYQLFTGQAIENDELQYTLLNYRVNENGSNITVSN